MTAIVTGAGGAIGQAIAIRLAADGHRIGVLDVEAGAAKRTAEMVLDNDGSALSLICDLRQDHQIGAAFEKAEEELGPIEVLVNNAAVFPSGSFVDVSTAELDDAIRVNQRAYFLCAQMAARSMIRRSRGAILNVASITWHGGWPNMAPYVMTKGAIVALTRALATELGPYEIRVNALAPGAFPTAAEKAQHPDLEAYESKILESQAISRRGTLEELAAAASFLVGSEASFITGQTLNVDGGWIMD